MDGLEKDAPSNHLPGQRARGPWTSPAVLGYSQTMDASSAPLFASAPALPEVLLRLGFGFVDGIPAAGMAEPWKDRLAETIAALREAGIGAVLTLTEDDPFGADYRAAGFATRHAPMDDGEPASAQSLDAALRFLSDCAGRGLVTCVHCLEGRARTGMVLWAFLARRTGLPAADALARLRACRPWTAFAHGQKECVAAYLAAP